MRAGFRTTRWSVVSAAGRWRPGQADDEVRRALGELAETDWRPLDARARRRGADREQAADLAPGRFAELVEIGALDARPDERARPELHLDARCTAGEPDTGPIWSAGPLCQGAAEERARREGVGELPSAAETAPGQR